MHLWKKNLNSFLDILIFLGDFKQSIHALKEGKASVPLKLSKSGQRVDSNSDDEDSRNTVTPKKQTPSTSSTIPTSLKRKQSTTYSPKRPRKSDEVFEVEALLKHKIENSESKFLVQWKGYSKRQNTWVLEKDLKCNALLKKFKKQSKMEEVK